MAIVFSKNRVEKGFSIVILPDNCKSMNPQSKLLLVIGIFVLTESCFGQNHHVKNP
jgi:hypothetical protein